jgi:hypothetical protein
MLAHRLRWPIAAIIVLVLIALLASIAGSNREPDTSTAVELAVTPVDAAGESDTMAPAGRAASAAPAPPPSALDQPHHREVQEPIIRSTPSQADAPRLPPVDAPLVDILGTLTRRADAGDPAAACRLAADLVRCKHRADLLSGINRNFLMGNDSAERPFAAAEHPDQQRLARANRICAGVPSALIAEAFRRTMDAADLGHPGARRWLAMYGESELARYAFDAPEQVQRWHHSLVRWAISSLDAGDRRVGSLWAGAASFPMDTPINALLETDPTLRLALLRYEALRRQRDGEPMDRLAAAAYDELAPGLPPASVAMAEAAAQRWVAVMAPVQSHVTPRTYAERLMAYCGEP